jgi:2-C-methyl-D-erythritol 4-phosphate cytidylyltransferase
VTTSDRCAADVAVVIPAAGEGVRLGPGAPKALRLLGGEPLLAHAVRRVAAARSVGLLVVAAPPHLVDTVREVIGSAFLRRESQERLRQEPTADEATSPPPYEVVAGGAQRQQSVAAALASVPAGFDIVLVHDAARALTPPGLVEQVAAAVRAGHDAVIPVLPVADTVTRVDSSGASLGHLDRSTLRAVQTPQGFRRAVLARAHAAADATAATDDAGLVARTGVPVHTVAGSGWALKITTPLDLEFAEALLAERHRI